MNERNVAALREILAGLLWHKEYPPDRLEALAVTLADTGVLVPSALTDEQAKSATDEGGMMVSDDEMEYTPKEFRVALTNIAKAGTVGLPWALPAGERIRSGDNLAIDPASGKLVRWRNGLLHFCYARKDVGEGEVLRSDEAFSG